MEKMERTKDKHVEKQMKLLNECASIVYENMGYNVDKEFDFSKSRHPQEQACFAIAVRIFNHIQDKT